MFGTLKSAMLVLGMCVLAVTLSVGCKGDGLTRAERAEVESLVFKTGEWDALSEAQKEAAKRLAEERGVPIIGNEKRYW